MTGGLSVHEDTRVFVGGPGRTWKGVRTLRRDLLFTEARGDGVVRELSFSQIFSFFSFYLEHRPFSLRLLLCMAPSLSRGLPPSLPYCPFQCVTFCLGCYPAHRAKRQTGKGGETVLYCHGDWTPFGWRKGKAVWVQRKRGKKRQQNQPLGVEVTSHPLCPIAAAPALPHPCPCPSSCAEAAEFEGNMHTDTLVQLNPVFLGRLHHGATLGSHLLPWYTTTSPGEFRAVWESFRSVAPSCIQRAAIQKSCSFTCRGAWIWAVACLQGKSL